jgi:hypothetical protein
VANAIYSFLAMELTKRENHRTDTQHEDSLIAKIFVFQFVNSYASFFYLAFIARSFNDCPGDNHDECMGPLAYNLAIVFGTRLVTMPIFQTLIPYIMYCYRIESAKKQMGADFDRLTQAENEQFLDHYDVSSSR